VDRRREDAPRRADTEWFNKAQFGTKLARVAAPSDVTSKSGDAMQTDEHLDDVQAIEALIARQFGSLSWTPETMADWDAFAADFIPEASLYPAARPAKRQTVEGFVERMKGLAGQSCARSTRSCWD
jgi:hypothetical protein